MTSIVGASYILFLLLPHHRNFNKRLVKASKLYFHDTGLAAWLLGLQNAHQPAIHQQRGALFETWVVAERFKERYNRSLPSNFFLGRNNTGNEVDVILDLGLRLIRIEIKSRQTTNADYFSGLQKWQSRTGREVDEADLASGGNERRERKEGQAIPWPELTWLEEKG